MKFFKAFRLVAHVLLLVFSLIVLGISVNLVYKKSFVPDWFAYSLFVALLTLIVGGIALAMNQLKHGAITNVVIAELIWTFNLGIFWLAAAANQTGASLLTCSGLDIIGSIGTSAGSIPDFGGPLGGTGLELGDMGGYPEIGITGSVDLNEIIRSYKSLCQQYYAVEAFSWLNWLILWAWMLSLLCLAIVGYNRGNKAVFCSSVGSTDFLATNVGSWQSEKSESEPPQYSNACPPKHQFAPQFSHEAVKPGAAS